MITSSSFTYTRRDLDELKSLLDSNGGYAWKALSIFKEQHRCGWQTAVEFWLPLIEEFQRGNDPRLRFEPSLQ